MEDIKGEVDFISRTKDNLTYTQRQVLKKLIIDDTIIINKAAKAPQSSSRTGTLTHK